MAKNEDKEVIIDQLEELGSEPRVYELGFHLDPELPTEGVKKQYQAIRELIASRGTLIAEVEPEKIQLAYTISRQEVAGRRDFSSAYFAWIAYETTPENHAAIIDAARTNGALVRFIDLITTKDAARHALEAHELAAKTAAEQRADEDNEPSEGTMRTELNAALENTVV